MLSYLVLTRQSRKEVLFAHSHSSICLSVLFYSRVAYIPSLNTMSGRRSRSKQSSVSRITDEQIADLVSKLQQLIPELRRRRFDKASSSKVLQETCNYIRSLHREVEDLSERLSQLLASTDSDSDQAAIIRSLLM
ncbi:hypothetical protein GQ457_04G011290 [Hibiscus cannabinus]